jgi:pyruvate,water dikinase
MNDKAQKTRPGGFPLPSEIQDLPDTAGWQSMYPYYARFRPEDDKRFWFYNSMHFPEPMPAFDILTAEVPYTGMGAFTTRVFAFPTALGVEFRVLNGRVYLTANRVEDDEEVAKRLAIFQERAGFYYENWDKLYEEWRQRLRALISEIDAIEVPPLPEFEDVETVTKATGIGQNHFVRENFHRCIHLFSKMWHHHFEFLMLGYGAYVVFFQFCKKIFPEIPDQMVSRMVAGIDVLMFRPDDELKKLATAAVEFGLDDAFDGESAPAKILEDIKARGKAGERWLKEFEKSRDPWFNLSNGDGFYHHHLSWNDDLSVPFSVLPTYIAQIKAGESLERPTERLKAERAEIIGKYRALLPSDDEREAFDQMLGLCHQVFPFVEDHKFYCEHWFTTRFFKKIREFGQLVARFGVLADAEDIFQLHHTEVDQLLTDIMLAWASGGKPVGAEYWQPIVAERKRLLEIFRDWQAPPALGPIPPSIEDPALSMLWGITTENLEAWSKQDEVTDTNEIRGFAASPGVVEGVARVLMDVQQISTVKEGDILVCPVTAPSWGAVFGRIKAAVSDIGGTMSHAAIVAREYGLPAVVGTGCATRRIKNGQRLRVDGDRGIVTILD